jgi:hypothetical protein
MAAAVAVAGLGLGASSPPAGAAGIVTHAWMALDAVDHVRDADLHALLDAHRDQVRAGAEFPDGGYGTRALGTPGGDYGEEAHWQRFIDAYVDQIRSDPTCGDLRDPAGPCAAEIAHAFGAAAHGMGDEVWDWLFEPNGPGFGEDYLPPEWSAVVGPGGLEAQLDVEVIARHQRPVGPTPAIPDPARIGAAFAAVGRGDISISALTVGDAFLDIERNVEASWVAAHTAALERAMPWTTAHVTSSAGGVDFAARAIAGYYDGMWARLLGAPHRTQVSVVAPAAGSVRVPATGWTGDYSPGSHAGNSGGLTRIAAALSSALPFNATAGGGSVPSELPVTAFRLRVASTGALVPPKPGYPRIVPYNPEAGEHVIAFQPAADLQPCTRYRAEVTAALVDADHQPVEPYSWAFTTSGCRGRANAPIVGTVTCATTALVAATASGGGGALTRQDGCAGGQDGRTKHGAALPIATGAGTWSITFGQGGCAAFAAGGAATISGDIQWKDAAGRDLGTSHVAPQAYDLRGTELVVDRGSPALPGHVLSLRIVTEPAPCTPWGSAGFIGSTTGRTTAWAPGS